MEEQTFVGPKPQLGDLLLIIKTVDCRDEFSRPENDFFLGPSIFSMCNWCTATGVVHLNMAQFISQRQCLW